MNHKSIARKFLSWFSNEAAEFGEEVFYAPGTDYVERYRHCQDGCLYNAMQYVRRIAGQRLCEGEATRVIEEARKLLRPNG